MKPQPGKTEAHNVCSNQRRASMISLYDCATAPSPRRARIMLAEKGVKHDTVQIDLRSAEQFGDAYRAINPQCTVPALRLDDGRVLTDNAGIAAYLEAAFPEPALLGTTPWQKAQIASWQWRIEVEGMGSIADALRNSVPTMKERALPGPVDYAQIPELAERGLARLQRFFETLNAQLDGRDTVVDSGFSIADITAVVAVDFARIVRIKPGDAHPHLLRWREAMAQRPAMSL